MKTTRQRAKERERERETERKYSEEEIERKGKKEREPYREIGFSIFWHPTWIFHGFWNHKSRSVKLCST